MILPTCLRQQSVLRASRAAYTPFLRPSLSQTRRLHEFPRLPHSDAFAERGVGSAISSTGFDLAWTQYMGFWLRKLNSLTAKTADEHLTPKNLVLKYARTPDKAALFNYASMVHNNHLFFSGLTPNPTPPDQVLMDSINKSFSSFDSFRSTFVATGNAMFGPGFVWLVSVPDPQIAGGRLAILNTYNAGTPYPGAHYRRQGADQATNPVSGSAGSFGLHSSQNNPIAGPGLDLEVLMGISTWEHVWLQDWGVNNKQGYLEAVFESINWQQVANNWKGHARESQYNKAESAERKQTRIY